MHIHSSLSRLFGVAEALLPDVASAARVGLAEGGRGRGGG